MNLRQIPIDSIPVGKALPWQLYTEDGSLAFPQGERIASREQLAPYQESGLFRNTDESSLAKGHAHSNQTIELRSSEIFPPDGIKPQVGERVQLRLVGRNRNSHIYYQSRLIGYIRELTVLITTPVANGKRIDIIDGEILECSMINGSHIHIFESEVIRVCASPSHYLHLRYPAVVKMQKLRNGPRAKVNIGASVTDTNGKVEKGHILNLSPDGAQIIMPSHVGGNGQTLTVSFPANADGLNSTLTLTGLIQHVRPLKTNHDGEQGSPEKLEYGIAFSNIREEEKLWLMCIVYLHIAEGSLI
jgi:hypothetical protein